MGIKCLWCGTNRRSIRKFWNFDHYMCNFKGIFTIFLPYFGRRALRAYPRRRPRISPTPAIFIFFHIAPNLARSQARRSIIAIITITFTPLEIRKKGTYKIKSKRTKFMYFIYSNLCLLFYYCSIAVQPYNQKIFCYFFSRLSEISHKWATSKIFRLMPHSSTMLISWIFPIHCNSQYTLVCVS